MIILYLILLLINSVLSLIILSVAFLFKLSLYKKIYLYSWMGGGIVITILCLTSKLDLAGVLVDAETITFWAFVSVAGALFGYFKGKE